MNNISQISIFDYTEIENLGDLEKLKLFLENVEDDELCEILEKERRNGFNIEFEKKHIQWYNKYI